jgi:hypothetical protein
VSVAFKVSVTNAGGDTVEALEEDTSEGAEISTPEEVVEVAEVAEA